MVAFSMQNVKQIHEVAMWWRYSLTKSNWFQSIDLIQTHSTIILWQFYSIPKQPLILIRSVVGKSHLKQIKSLLENERYIFGKIVYNRGKIEFVIFVYAMNLYHDASRYAYVSSQAFTLLFGNKFVSQVTQSFIWA